MDTAFGWAGAGQQHEDVYLPRSVGQMMSCGAGRFEMDDAFLGACFGQLLQCDGDVGDGGVGGAGGGDGARQVSSSYGAVGGAVSDPMGFLSSGAGDVFASVVDGARVHDGLLDTALAFSTKEHACRDGDGEAVSNSAMFSGYSGTTGGNISSGESNNYSGGGGGGNDAEVGSPTSTISPTAPSSLAQALHQQRKLADDYPTIAAAPPAPAPLPRPGAKRKATPTSTTSITFGQGATHDTTAGAAGAGGVYEPDMEAMAQVKEMIYRAAAMRPVSLVTAESPADGKPRRKNVRISSDPQTVAARLRRERVSDRLRMLQKLVPGGSKMDTASMLDEAASYLKFLKSQVQALETLGTNTTITTAAATTAATTSSTARLQQHYCGNNPGFFGFSRNNKNISLFGNPNGNATKLL